jgi:hypothetical protein
MLPDQDIARQLAGMQKRIEALDRQRSGAKRLIDSNVLTGLVASFTFSNIPNIYAHLLILYYARSDRVATNTNMGIRFNADAGNNYDALQAQERQPSTLFTGQQLAATRADMALLAAGTAPANVFDSGAIRINHYANTANQKSMFSSWTFKIGIASGNIRSGNAVGFWRNAAAITSITIFDTVANFVAGSRFELYGIQGGE